MREGLAAHGHVGRILQLRRKAEILGFHDGLRALPSREAIWRARQDSNLRPRA